ncbi:16S rRNA (uracil(1498)-N(3))-methyltransferase [Thalassobacillus pellis]|uniref:16S rRNA (uracil(1498)-N(3))-methyltransferase n=1 Tax=Thalassobacillus pellis TaxID=748008 RepID=UPI001960313E|nr:16S rRNA (uracil(1498)-N(3))-methyltransferase [Thalassobacillus pellis]MBM7554717.1 16S rRNA (uracil1498-N3)-methyltransferase [Thalassobacillus pellis]
MQRYFVDKADWQGDKVTIRGDDVHHISRVMRMDAGDEIICTQSGGKAAVCKIAELTADAVICKVDSLMEESTELPVTVTIVQALGKGDKLETVIQKGTELGADQFIPYQADRSVVKWDRKKAEKKAPRMQKIAKEASEQSHRLKVPSVSGLHSINEILALSDNYDVKIFAYEDEAKQEDYHSLSSVMASMSPGMRMIAVIGPEGGFSEKEVRKFYEAGFQSVRLGPRILRMETAPLYLLASISYHFEELR